MVGFWIAIQPYMKNVTRMGHMLWTPGLILGYFTQFRPKSHEIPLQMSCFYSVEFIIMNKLNNIETVHIKVDWKNELNWNFRS